MTLQNHSMLENSLVVQWLGLCAFTAEGPGSIPGQGTKIPQATANNNKKMLHERTELCVNGYWMSTTSESGHDFELRQFLKGTVS